MSLLLTCIRFSVFIVNLQHGKPTRHAGFVLIYVRVQQIAYASTYVRLVKHVVHTILFSVL